MHAVLLPQPVGHGEGVALGYAEGTVGTVGHAGVHVAVDRGIDIPLAVGADGLAGCPVLLVVALREVSAVKRPVLKVPGLPYHRRPRGVEVTAVAVGRGIAIEGIAYPLYAGIGYHVGHERVSERVGDGCLVGRHVMEVGERGLATLAMVVVGVKSQAVAAVVAPFQLIGDACLHPLLAVEAPGVMAGAAQVPHGTQVDLFILELVQVGLQYLILPTVVAVVQLVLRAHHPDPKLRPSSREVADAAALAFHHAAEVHADGRHVVGCLP